MAPRRVGGKEGRPAAKEFPPCQAQRGRAWPCQPVANVYRVLRGKRSMRRTGLSWIVLVRHFIAGTRHANGGRGCLRSRWGPREQPVMLNIELHSRGPEADPVPCFA